MTDVIQTVEQDAATLWQKVESWWTGSAVPALQADEKELLSLIQPLFGSAESAALQDLTVFIKGILSQVQSGQDLATLEQTVLNAAETLAPQLLTVATGLGSNVLQALIGLILAKIG